MILRTCTSPSTPRLPPCIGLGTFRSTGTDVQEAVLCALQNGIRHIDTASIYKNEHEIGLAIKQAIQSGEVTRDEVYITSKVSPYEMTTVDRVRNACNSILDRLDLSYVDLLLIHWPGVAKVDLKSPKNADMRIQTWKVLEQFYAEGKAKAIGVSNFEIDHLQHLLNHAIVTPAVNQVEFHPLWPQSDLFTYCTDHGIAVSAYSPFGAGALFTDPELAPMIKKIAQEFHPEKTVAQLLLCWTLQKGCCCTLPKSVRCSRVTEFSPLATGMQRNAQGRWLNIQAEIELDSLGDTVEKRTKFCWDPSTVL